jgi:hypothetical protein
VSIARRTINPLLAGSDAQPTDGNAPAPVKPVTPAAARRTTRPAEAPKPADVPASPKAPDAPQG